MFLYFVYSYTYKVTTLTTLISTYLKKKNTNIGETMGYVQVLLLYLLVSCATMKHCMGNEGVPIQINDDVIGLIVFKSGLNDPSSSLASWNQDDDSPCSWKFIQCNPKTGRVTQLNLDGLNLSGKISYRGLEKLNHLKVLSLPHNNFNGRINDLTLAITSLERLNLSHNSLSGLVPSSLVKTSSLRFLDLSHNSLSGPVPDDFFQNCTSLHFLSLSANFFEGPIPTTLKGCYFLNTLNLSNNHFSGDPEFSPGIWSLKRLRSLDLSGNFFSGSVPGGISALNNLKELQLQGNQFSGPLPVDLGLCLHVSRVDLSENLFNGALPHSLQRMSALTHFSASNNMLTGDFPIWISHLSNLQLLDLSNNGLTGTLPLSIGDLKSLSHLSLSNNKLVGVIPSSIVYCTSLSLIRLRGNSFNGTIPEGLFDLYLEEVDLSNNGLTGSIPPGSTKFFGAVRTIDLSGNHLTGNVRGEMGLSSNLIYLNLSWNDLKSTMPLELGYFQQLTVLDLRNSALSGSVPADICESGSLSILQLDGNSLTGPIPEEIGNCSALYLLSLSHNNLSGLIPNSISKLTKLKIIRLEYNDLTGVVPQELGKLENLVAVNISYNKLIGKLPAGGIFPSLDQSALQGNLGICSPLLKGPCKMNVPKPLVIDPYVNGNEMGGKRARNVPPGSKTLHDDHHMFLSVSALIAISAATFILIGVIVISVVNVSARKRLASDEAALESMCSSSSRSSSLTTGKLVLFSSKSSHDYAITDPESLLNKASEVGEGVFGTVYQATLGHNQNQRRVAIKKLTTLNIKQNPVEFHREVRLLGKAKHPNLLSLEGYYLTPQVPLLVSEFTPNGSLQAKLHDTINSGSPLSWSNRFKIIYGTAKALAYLHHSFQPPIIHYNVKPSNILLDENFNPKVSDFGLARLVSKLDKQSIDNRFHTQLCYMAPELACQSLRVDEKCDVYGFGVLVLEIVTGQRPVEYGEDNVVILNDQVRFLFEQGNVLDCVDPGLGNEYLEDEVLPVLKLALVCTSQVPSSRPSMAEVVQILQVIKTSVSQRMDIL